MVMIDVNYIYKVLLTSSRLRSPPLVLWEDQRPLKFEENDPNIATVELKKYYRPQAPKNGTVCKLAKIIKNNSKIPKPTIDVI